MQRKHSLTLETLQRWQLVRHIVLSYVLKTDGVLTDSFSIARHASFASLPHSLYEPSPTFRDFLTNKLLRKCKFSITDIKPDFIQHTLQHYE